MSRALRDVLLVVMLLGGGWAAGADAQQAAPGRERHVAPRERRAELEGRVREQIAKVVRNRLRLTDEQFRRLVGVNQEYEEQFRKVVGEEREIRLMLRGQMRREDQADQQRIAEGLTQLARLQRRRLDLFEQEQRELAEFLTPLQRAKYAAMRERIRRRMEQMRQRRMEQLQRGVSPDAPTRREREEVAPGNPRPGS